MATQRQAIRALHDHLVEEVGVDEATILTDRVEGILTRDDLDDALRRQSQGFAEQMVSLQHQMASAWRKDLLLVSVAQFFALAAAVGSLAALS